MSLQRVIHTLTDLMRGTPATSHAPFYTASGWQSLPTGSLNVRALGAVADGATDDSDAIQDAIDAAETAGGGIVLVPPGDYVCNVTLKEGVYLLGGGRGYPQSAPNVSCFTAAATGVVVDTPLTTIRNCGISGINIQGLGASTPLVGVRFRDVTKGVIRDLTTNNTADQGVLVDGDSGAGIFEDIQVLNALLNRTRAAVAGAVDIAGTDHWVSRVEATASVTGAVTSASLFCAGFVWRATNGVLHGIIGEISDIGVYDLGALSRWSACRADLNRGHGLVSEGSGNQISDFLAFNNGQAADNTYDNIWFKSTSSANQTANLKASSTLTNKARYGINDEVVSGSQKNIHTNPSATGAVTQQYKGASSNGSAWHFPRGGAKTLTANSATPDVSGCEHFITANTSATTITNFTGGVPGQRIVILCNDTNTTIAHNGSTIGLLNSGSKQLRRLAHYEFIYSGALWREVAPFALGVTADVGDAAKTLQARLNEEVQIWNTALTVDRAVTLSTTGAYAGATFRIVRTASATGAFNLNVGTGPLKALAAGQWADVTYNGTAWVLTAAGSL